MHGKRNRSVTAFTAAIALAVPLGVAAVGNSLVDGAPLSVEPAAAAVPVVADPGLVLATGSTDEVRFYDGTGASTTRVQPLNAGRKCDLDTDNSLLSITGFVGASTTDQASYYADSIGVAEKTSGTSCSQVGSATKESLVLAVNPGLRGSVFPLLMDGARLDVELKQSARILADATRGGERVWTFDLQSGASIGSEKPEYAGDRYSLNKDCLTSADSGPDSKAGDNCMWTLAAADVNGNPVVFDTLTLRVEFGDFSLEGGGDWLVPEDHRSVFSLVEYTDGILDCKESVARDARDGGTVPGVTVYRMPNAAAAPGALVDPCVKVPYSLANGLSSARFLKPLTEQPRAQFIFDFVWTTSPSNTTWTTGQSSDSLIPRTYVDYEADGKTDSPISIAWCPDLVTAFDGETKVVIDGKTDFMVVRDVASNVAATDQDATITGKQFSCLVSQSIESVDGSPDKVIVKERIYVYGDIALRK